MQIQAHALLYIRLPWEFHCGLTLNIANFDDLTRDPTPLIQQQSFAARIGLNMPAVSSGLDNTAIAPPPFEVSLVKSSRFAKIGSSNPIQAVPLHFFPTLQPITTVTTVVTH